MGARARCFVVPYVALVLAAASLAAQDSAPVEQPPRESLPADQPCLQAPCAPSWYFQADWLATVHGSTWCNTRNFIDGPDAASFDNLPAFTGENGYRFQGGIRLGSWIFEGIYSHYGDWNASLNQNVNGVAFNAPAAAGNWAGLNSINANTYFAPIFNAASLTTPVNTAGDQSGLGPSAAFPADGKPALMASSHTDFYVTEANVKTADYYFPLFGHGVRLGAGYVNANLNNNSWLGMTGTFRASNGTGTVSLPDSALTASTGGNLVFYTGGTNGAGTGFTDGISNGGTGTASQLFFTHTATTRNELNGVQLILDGDLFEFQHLEIGASLKGGVFDNYAQGNILETYGELNVDQSGYAREFAGSCHHVAFMGGIGVSAEYHATDVITICAGYDAVFLSNLALGPEQINGVVNNWYHVQTDGSALIQAVHAGLEIAF